MFLLCAVKVPDAVTEMMMAEFQHQEACQRINSILKFNTLWRFRYQVWPRMEEGAQQIFKVRNSNYVFLFRVYLHLSSNKLFSFNCFQTVPPNDFTHFVFFLCLLFQIPPPSINFTLPSPILGMPCVPIFDPPWVPQNTGSVQDPINEDQSVSLSLDYSLHSDAYSRIIRLIINITFVSLFY